MDIKTIETFNKSIINDSKNIIENGPDDIVRFIVLAIVCEALLIIGYRRRKTDDILD